MRSLPYTDRPFAQHHTDVPPCFAVCAQVKNELSPLRRIAPAFVMILVHIPALRRPGFDAAHSGRATQRWGSFTKPGTEHLALILPQECLTETQSGSTLKVESGPVFRFEYDVFFF